MQADATIGGPTPEQDQSLKSGAAMQRTKQWRKN
jgi:hypothetical protein